MEIHRFFEGGQVDVERLAIWLDALDPDRRVAEVGDLGAREQARLYDAAAGFRPLSLADFVPADRPPLQEVIHHGRNSLPLFRRFQKRFCRPPGEARELWGYNEQALKALTGPGYFVVEVDAAGQVVIDYTRLPEGAAPGWPPRRPNDRGLSRFVYHGTRDAMRGVSRHVSIGRASMDGRPMDNWFVLCREDR